MIDFKGGNIRTNLSVLVVSGTQTLVGVLLVFFSDKFLPNIPFFHAWYWSALVLSSGIAGVLLLLAKDLRRPAWFRWLLGGIALLQQVLSIMFASPVPVAFCAAAVVFVGYALWVDEPGPGRARYDLIKLHAGASLVLLALAALLFKGPQELPLAPVWYLPLALTAGLLVYAHLRQSGGRLDRLATVLVGLIFIALAGAALFDAYYITALYFLPFGTTLLFLPLFKNYSLGTDDRQTDADAEALVVRQFERASETVAWAAFLFTYVSLYFYPRAAGAENLLFLLFVAAYLIFTVQYTLLPAARSNFRRFHRKSLMNAALLGVVCHLTGGLRSPYDWFFIFVLIAGSAAPQPVKILDRLYLVLGYYAFETAYAAETGTLDKTVLLNGLLLPVFILALTGLYAFRLSTRRQQIDADLMKANDSYKEALARETAAKELIGKQAEEIGLARQRDEALLSSLADAVIAVDPNGMIILVNPVAEGVLGYRADEVKGKRLRDLLLFKRENDPSFRLGAYVDTGLHGSALPLPDGLFLERQDGGKTYYTGMILPVLDEAKRPNGAVAVMQDVTYLREIDQMKTSFLSVAAHQLRTPLSTIRWYLELLNDPAEGRLNKDQKSFAENAYTSLLRMVGLINRLLAITRLEAERVPVRPEPIDLKTLTADILADAERKLREHGLEASASIPDHLTKVALDPTLAREVLVNLLENAIRYTPKGGTIAIAARDAGDELVWSIKDDGIGIPKDEQAKIFEKFFRATNAVDLSSEGSGLGLYLARFIVGNWGGKLTFESAEGKGSVFRVTVPKKGMTAKSGQVSLNA